MNRAVFLDRDGVIIENRHDYVKSWDEVEFIPGAIEAIARLTSAGFPVVMVTNQSAVGRGIITEDFVRQVHDQMKQIIEAGGGRIDSVYFCPHRPDAGCDCRKPAPGMIYSASHDLGIDLEHSFIIGDALSDVAAGNAAGVTGLLVLTGRGEEQARKALAEGTTGLPVFDSIVAAVDFILQSS